MIGLDLSTLTISNVNLQQRSTGEVYLEVSACLVIANSPCWVQDSVQLFTSGVLVLIHHGYPVGRRAGACFNRRPVRRRLLTSF